ncbi:type I restriction enzyme HsdR N-terminal domain-containing protein [Fulvivirga sp. M361]|uniref:type I restriction enzyme HsdR N-terminal domain-containing protein n=1 Tax=Fulvivirga sp. M361 TaxID=2594266 RepID=UPI001C881CD0|nr:type I restriction enzyme HsdR N-terminal domain-containing protein [Fulvivirga sp. M361]
MIQLNLPQIACNIRKNDGKPEIFDAVRKKYVALTPEEWVRQHFIHYLVNQLEYPKSLLSVETGMKYHTLSKRTDILVYNRDMSPLLLTECKSFKVRITQSSLNQVAVYNRMIKAPYMVLTNGLKHYCCHLTEKNYEFIEEIPPFPL